MAMILQRLPGTRLFLNVALGSGARWATEATFCFFHQPDTAADYISLADTRKVRGTYAFLPPNPTAPFDMLASALAAVVPANGHRLQWMQPEWQTATHDLAFVDGVTTDALSLSFWPFATLAETGNGSGELALDIPARANVDFGDDHLILQDASLQIVLFIDGEPLRKVPAGHTIEIRMEPGPRCATVAGRLSSADTADWIAALTPQVRYMWRRNAVPIIKAARILSNHAADHRHVSARFQLQSFSAHRDVTRIDLVADGVSAAMVSCLPDTSAHMVELCPSQGAAIYFEQFQGIGNYASLWGRFALKPNLALHSGPAASRDIMPGTAGTEFFQLHKDGYDGLEFHPGRAAFVQFAAGSEPPTITLDRTTAWISPCRTGASAAWATAPYSFVAQPQHEPLYGRRHVDGVRSAAAPSETSTVFFDPAPAAVPPGTGLPFFPFLGIPKNKARDTERLDVEALAPERSRIVADVRKRVLLPMATAADTTRTWLTTPQGLLVEIDAANDWHQIKLGESTRWEMVIERPKVNGIPVARWALQEAMSRSEVFVVISRQKQGDTPATGDPAFGAIKLKVDIGGWALKVDLVSTTTDGGDPNEEPPALDSGEAPVLVFKFSKGEIGGMLGNVGRWALARLFNESPQEASNGALLALDRLKTLSEGRSPMVAGSAQPEYKRIAAELVPHYQALYKKVTDPDWTGVLVLNAHVPFHDVPPALSVVTEGAVRKDQNGNEVKVTEFSVPVVGLDLSRVVPDAAGQLRLERTSAFGAIHFHSPEPLPADEEGFDFKLRTLNAIFDNSELRTFLASMQLRLAQYFGADMVADSRKLVDIICRYEGKSAAGQEAEYVFRALGSRTMAFTGNAFLDKLTVDRIDLTSRRVGRDVESRFGMWGSIEFGEPFSKITGIRKIAYENAALVMRAGEYNIDAGNVRVDFKKEDSAISGLLKKFPFQLSGMRWASMESPLELSGIGFTRIALPGFPNLDAPSFDFALELDVNLGSMGKLFEAAEFLKARILVGWYKPRTGTGYKGFSVGFRFDGGNGPLDIGVNGVMRLTAEAVNLQTYDDPAGVGIGLLNPQLEVMGYKVPERPRDRLVAFVPRGESNVAWAWARLDTDVGPLKLHYFALGQRMHLVEPGAFDNDAKLKDIVEGSRTWVNPKQHDGTAELPDIGKLYTQEAGWGVVADGSVSAFKFRFVFLDGLNRYGLGLDIPNIADIDVLYRKLSDGVGVFSAEIVPAFRTLEMGAATVTLPIVGVDALTNGNWSINIGYHGNDFSRGTSVQLLPFLGSGGVRFGKLDWRSSYVLNSPHSTNGPLIQRLRLDPVIEMSMAARVGIGKEYREGVFAAGITLSVYGIFEGAFGRPTDPAFPSGAPRRYIKLAGTAGLLLEIFGAVNFAVVNAAVSIRVWVEMGLTLESWTAVVVHAEAGVSVYVRFVIARFKIFGRRIEIAIHFSFATRVRFTQKLPYAFDGDNPYGNTAQLAWRARQARLLAHKCTQPLQWTLHELASAPAPLRAAVTLEPMLSGSNPLLLPMLFAGEGAGEDAFSGFTVKLFTWALRLSLGIWPGAPTPDKVSVEELSALCSRVSPPKGTSLARWGGQPLNFDAFQAFLQKHLRIDLQNVAELLAVQRAALQAAGLAAQDTAEGVLLPWFADIAIRATAKGEAPITLRDFRAAHSRRVDIAWERGLFDMLTAAMPDYQQDDCERLKTMLAAANTRLLHTDDKEALDAITEDWAAALVQGVTQRATLVARERAKPMQEGGEPVMAVAELLQALVAPADGGSLAAQVGKHASTFLHHGLRVPEHAGDTVTAPLAQFLRTELPLAEFAAAKEWTLEFAPREGFAGGWIAGTTKIENLQMANAADHLQLLARSLGGRKIELTAYVEDSDLAKTTQPRRFVVDTLVPLGLSNTGTKSIRTASVPAALNALAQRRGGSLTVVPRLEVPRDDTQKKDCPARWFVKIDVQLAVRNIDKKRPVYAVHHVDARIRALLRQMIDASIPLVRKVRLAYKVKDETAAVPLQFLEQDEAFFFVSNLSKEPNPPQAALKGLSRPTTPTHATLADTDALAQILWMASTINAPGFHLAFKRGNDPLGHLFEKAAIGSVSLLFELDPAAVFTPLIDGVLIDEALVDEKHVLSLTTPQVRESLTGTPDGQVAVIVERVNPLHGLAPGSDDDEADLRYLQGRFELVDYWTDPAQAVMERGSVIPTRLVMDEDEQAAAAQEDQPRILRHRIMVPLAKLAGHPNPYDVVGTDVATLVRIGLRDGAGHYLDDGAFDLKWMANRPTRLLYRDALLRLQELPGVQARWRLAPQGADAAVNVALHWSVDDLFSTTPALAAQQREALVALFQRATDAASTRDFRARLEVSFDGTVVAQLEVQVQVRDWLHAIREELAAKTNQPCTRELAATLPAAAWPVSTPQPVRMDVVLGFYRDPALCDQRLLDYDQNGQVSDAEKKASEIATVRSPVLAADLVTPAEWVNWARSVRDSFQSSLSLLRRMEVDVDTRAERELGPTVWLFRRNMLTTAQTTATAEGFFAPAPLARTFQSGSVQVPLADGQATLVEARDVDLNASAARAAGALEIMVSRTVGEALCQWRPDLYARLALAKRGVADAMAGRLESILKNGGDAPDKAVEKFRNACRADTAVAFAPAALVNVPLAPAAAGRTFLWGTVGIDAAQSAAENASPLSFSPVRVPLGAAGIEGSFDFVVHWAQPGANPLAVVSGAMHIRPQYVEVSGRQEIDGYIPSDWYEVVWSGELGAQSRIAVHAATGREWHVPLPLRLIPPTPTILRHGATAARTEDAPDLGGYIDHVRSWQYGVSVMVPAMDHDTADVTVRFGDAATLKRLTDDALFKRLVAYNFHAQAIDRVAADLAATGQADENDLELAVRLFEMIAEALASPPAALAATTARDEDVRCIRMRTRRFSDKPLPAEIRWTVSPAPYQGSVRTTLLDLKSVTDDDIPLQPDAGDPAQGIARYERAAAAGLALKGMASLSPRHVRLSGLDVMVQGRALPSVIARRNAELLTGGAEIAPNFIFETPAVQTPDSLVPRLTHRDPFDLSRGSRPRPIQQWLTALREALVRGADASKFAFDLTARFKLPLVRDGDTSIDAWMPLASLKSAPAAERDWVNTLAQLYLAAIGRLAPSARQAGELHLNVQVFPVGASESQKPVLSLPNLILPLANVTGDAVASLAALDGMDASDLPLHQLAAYVFERSHHLPATDEATVLRQALAARAGREVDEAAAAHLPSPADLSSEEGRAAWVAALRAAAVARQNSH